MRGDPEMLIICYRFVHVLTGIGFYMCGKFADILATEKALSVNFILRLIKNTKKKSLLSGLNRITHIMETNLK